MPVTYRTNDELLAAENPHEDYVCSYPARGGDWFCLRCHLRQMPNTNRYWHHDDAECDGTDDCDEWLGPLCPHCAEGLQP